MPQQEPQEEQVHKYELLVRDRTGERMNPCSFFARSDEDAFTIAAEHLDIPELSESHFESRGYFRLRRKNGAQLFPEANS